MLPIVSAVNIPRAQAAIRTPWPWASVAVALLVAFVVLVRPVNSAPGVASSIVCDTHTTDFDVAVTCSAAGPDDAVIDWGDGSLSPITGGFETTHPFAALGLVDVQLLSHDGDLLASTVISVAPDLSVTCKRGLPQPIYALAPAVDTATAPYDYIYLHPDSGEELRPGDTDYPENLGAMLALDRLVLDEAPVVGLCSAESAAADALDGTITWTVGSDWYPDYVTKTRKLTPGTPGLWDGVQPLDVAIVVEVDGHEASERIGVFFGGCG